MIPLASRPGRLEQDQDDDAAIAAAEEAYILARRQAMPRTFPPEGLDLPRVGLALSGGGIRSATFSLGVLKSLSRLKLIHRVDYLSTVSGGSYVGAFYVSLFTSSRKRGAVRRHGKRFRFAEDPLGIPDGERAIQHLRENGRYLLPGGAGDALRLATIAIRGWLAVQTVIAMSLLALFLSGKSLQATLVRAEWLQGWEVSRAERGWSSLLWPVQWLEGYPLGSLVILSALWPIAILCLAIAVAFGWAYWLARFDRIAQFRPWRVIASPSWWGTVLVATVGILLHHEPSSLESILTVIGVLSGGAAVAYIIAELVDFWAFREKAGPTVRAVREEEDRVRSRLTGWATTALFIGLAVAVLALVDTIGQSLYSYIFQSYTASVAVPLTSGALIAAATPFLRRILDWVQRLAKVEDILRRFGRWIAIIAALLLVLVIMSIWAMIADFLAWRGAPIGAFDAVAQPFTWPKWLTGIVALDALDPDRRGLLSLWMTAAMFVVIAVAIGMSFGFLNLSSFSGFYAGRLRRAYLGASNFGRVGRIGTDSDDAGDDIALTAYYEYGTGAPLHLVNVTINETRSAASALVQRDRKGRPMTLSPAGYLVPTTGERRARIRFAGHNAALPQKSTAVDLPLSTWIAISGAAFSTALGRYTSLGFSLLAGLSNLRLGYWWAPLATTGQLAVRPFEWVQRYLQVEFFARFAGIYSHRWYLTDGGHFENTGIYELVRRRVELIIACDNAADPNYVFEDIINVTRKLRIDFDADLDFLPQAELDKLLGPSSPTRMIFGELSQLVRLSKEHSSRGPYAAIARIRIPARNGNREYLGTLILIKPRLSGLEMADLLDYNRINQDFPQQTTGDQFFDEAQWESYYRLGITIADLVFATPSRERPGHPSWSPADLHPIDPLKAPWFTSEWVRAAKPHR